ncbi:MAG: IS3 family transposase [Elusimicrobia bacterium]|nr:IS3 family transposase [Elusimicrobiota bacterium]
METGLQTRPQERLSRSRTTKGPGRRKPEAPAGVEKCRRRARDSKKNFNHLVAPKVERFRLIRRYEKEHRVDLMCRALDVSRSGYYWRRGAAVSSREQENQVLLNQIKEIFENSRRTYGSPRVTEELQERGFRCGRHRVARLMRRAGIQAKVKKRFRAKGHKGKRFVGVPNLVQRVFSAPQANRLWLADITYIWTREGWTYLAAILDVYSRKIVGWSLGRRPTTELARAAFERALGQRKGEPGLVHHSGSGGAIREP